MRSLAFLFSLTLALPLCGQSPAPPPQLADYIAKNDGAFTWKIIDRKTENGATITVLNVTSQKWQGELWEHDVQIFLPDGVKPTATVILYNDGGSINSARTAFGLALAQKAKAPLIFVLGVPKQPLYGKREDALIAQTFVKFLETKDTTWPLLFPMVKSVIRGMDAVQAYAKQEWKSDVTGFVVAGASKRGWTSWLTAATGDKRVKAIAPLVFDSLNLLEQMPHQVKSFGRYSEMIRDYEQQKLLPLPDTTEARQLWGMVDPYAYLDKLSMPKMIVNGANDRYWAADALNFYWNDLKGPKNVLYVPNAGHDLRAMDDPSAEKPKKDLFPRKAVETLAAFSRSIIHDKPLPLLDATFAEPGIGQLKLDVSFSVVPKSYRVWHTTSETRDFRKAKWTADPDGRVGLRRQAVYEHKSEKPFEAFFLEAEFDLDGQRYNLSTPIRIVEKK